MPLSVMKHVVYALALAGTVARKGNANSVSDAGVSALMLLAAAESAALNVKINLRAITDSDFTGWRSEEVASLLKTGRGAAQEILVLVGSRIEAGS